MSQHEEEEDDLYGDLTQPTAQTQENQSSSTNKGCGGVRQIRAIPFTHVNEEEMAKLQAELDALKNENKTLRRNIGTLYRTAQKELERKDARILALEGNIKSG